MGTSAQRGFVGTSMKARFGHGCAHTIVYSREDFAKRVEEITEGKKVPVVYDSVGKDTFLKSLDCWLRSGSQHFRSIFRRRRTAQPRPARK